MNKLSTIFLLFFISVVVVSAQDGKPKKKLMGLPRYLFPQFTRSNDPANIAMAYTGAAQSSNEFGPLSNPAYLAEMNSAMATFSHIPSLYRSTREITKASNQEALCLVLPLPYGFAIGISAFNLNQGKIQIQDYQTKKVNIYSMGTTQIGVTGAKQLISTQRFSLLLGATTKYLYPYYGFGHGEAFLYDVGMISSWRGQSKWFSLGAMASNLGSDLKFKMNGYPGSDFQEEVFKLLRIGVSGGNLQKKLSGSADPQFTFSLEVQHSINSDEYPYESWNHLNIASECKLFHHLSGRIGYVFDLEKDESHSEFAGFTYGIGMQTPGPINILTPITLSFSYGKGIDAFMESVHVVALTLYFQR